MLPSAYVTPAAVVFAIGGLLAGVAAFVFAVYYGRPFGQNGAQSGLFAFTAAMLGGIGNPLGALVSALTLGVFGSFSDYFFNAEWTPALLLVLLIGLLFLRPQGFFAEGSTDDELSSAGLRDTLTPVLPQRTPDTGSRGSRRNVALGNIIDILCGNI